MAGLDLKSPSGKEVLVFADKNRGRKIGFVGEIQDPAEVKMRWVAMIMNCRDKSLGGPDKIYKEFKSLLEEKTYELNKKLDGVLSHSLGYGHNAAADHITFSYETTQVPRIVTLWQARYPFGHSLLQASTRAVPHEQVEIPISIKVNERALQIAVDSVSEAMELYFELNERYPKDIQDNMYVTPIGLLTNNSLTSSARGLWQMFTDSKYDFMPNCIKRTSDAVYNLMYRFYPFAFKEWKSNYLSLMFHPTGIDFLAPYTNKEKYFSKYSDRKNNPELYLSPERPVILLEKPSGDPSVILERFDNDLTHPLFHSGINLFQHKLAARIDISIMHQMIRHRTIPQNYEPFIEAAMRIKEAFKKGELIEDHFVFPPTLETEHENLKKSYLKSLNAFIKLIKEENIPPQEALFVLPHGMVLQLEFVLDGWGAMHFTNERLCITAKPGAREFAKNVRKVVKEAGSSLFELMAPKCEHLNYCPEGKKSTLV